MLPEYQSPGMESKKTGIKSLVKKLLIAGFILFVLASGIGWCLFNRSFDDTATIEADYTVNAFDLIKEFKQNILLSNKKMGKSHAFGGFSIVSLDA